MGAHQLALSRTATHVLDSWVQSQAVLPSVAMVSDLRPSNVTKAHQCPAVAEEVEDAIHLLVVLKLAGLALAVLHLQRMCVHLVAVMAL